MSVPSCSANPWLVMLLLLGLLVVPALGGSPSNPSTSVRGNGFGTASVERLRGSAGTWFNVLHVTDVHGWIYGHRHGFPADYGDFLSLVQHLRAQAEAANEEFVLVDSGDLIEGTGLSDATPIHGEDIFKVVQHIPFSVMTIGNHDLGHATTTDLMMKTFIPAMGDAYITSNSLWAASKEPMGKRYSVLQTSLGHTILALGFVYNFKQAAETTIVETVEHSLRQDWFDEAMAVPADMIVVAAHIDPCSPPELRDIYSAIRVRHPHKPLLLLVGHRHQLHFDKYDDNCFVVESGRFFNNIGYMRFQIAGNAMHNFGLQWVNTTLDNFYRLTATTSQSFLTKEGQALKDMIAGFVEELHLKDVLGCSQTTYDPSLPLSDDASFYRLLVDVIAPRVLFEECKARQHDFYITNTGFLRYPLFEGVVTRDDVFTINPFNDPLVVFESVPGAALRRIVSKAASSDAAVAAMAFRRAFEFRAESLPPFVHTLDPIHDGDVYNVIMAAYDSFTIGHIYDDLFPETGPHHAVPFSKKLTTTELFIQYVEQFMPCGSEAL